MPKISDRAITGRKKHILGRYARKEVLNFNLWHKADAVFEPTKNAAAGNPIAAAIYFLGGERGIGALMVNQLFTE